MKVGDLVKLADWCHHNIGATGIIVSHAASTDTYRILSNGETLNYHIDDFYVITPDWPLPGPAGVAE
jgi:hypothetical protein